MSISHSSQRQRPILRWAGSKLRIVSELAEIAPQKFERYIEPFAGSAALYFKLAPEKAILSDINIELINTYRQITKSPQKIALALSLIPRERSNYNFIRGQSPKGMTDMDRCVRFLYLNRNCFNGLYRTNKKGEFNVPFCGERSGKNLTGEDFSRVAILLRKASLRACDFEKTLEKSQPGDFVYIDPPFAISNKRMFSQYDAASFGTSDIDRLLSKLEELDNVKSKFLVSYAWNKDVYPLFRKWNLKRIRIHRNIAGFADKRRGAYEMIATNY